VPEPEDLVADVFERELLNRAVLSRPRRRSSAQPTRVVVEPVELKAGLAYRFTSHLPDRATSENLPPPAAQHRLKGLLADYGQTLLQTADADWQILGDTALRRAPTRPTADRVHDRSKRRLLEEGRPVPFLVELGVMTPDGAVRKSRYAKYRQVSRFLELVDDIVPALEPEGVVRVVDFGCGKSYLTFALHHLLTELRGREVEIVGIDRKADVVDACSALAERSRASGLRFQQGDIAGFDPGGSVDIVVALHACDTATDAALAEAVRWQANAILAVPCCHKEAYRQIGNDLLAPVFRHGVLKERAAALVTDALRAQLLELAGYRTQLVEFVDLEHTPKNVLIRATRGRPAGAGVRHAYEELRDALGLQPTLERLLDDP
jgi:SAM-dependent methyltransferase